MDFIVTRALFLPMGTHAARVHTHTCRDMCPCMAHSQVLWFQTSVSRGGSVTPPRVHVVSEETILESLWPQSPVRVPWKQDSLP